MDKLSFNDCVIALTGKLSKPSDFYAKLIAEKGGTYVSTVTKKTTHLVTADQNGTSDKLQKARKNAIKIWSEKDLVDALNIEMDVSSPPTKGGDKMANMPEMLLAEKYDKKKFPNLRGWWVSEKLDGVRSWWDGEHFWSRLGNRFHAPEWFCSTMPPNVILDGELFMDRQKFNETISIVKTHTSDQEWKHITFMVFDIPSEGKRPFEERLALLGQICQGRPHIHVVEQRQLTSEDHIEEILKQVENLGGEGLMLRQPKSQYIGKRSKTLLKIKSFHDEEAKILAYNKDGKGRLEGTIGSFQVIDAAGVTFEVGSGLTDEIRRNPPPIGSIITFRFQEKIEKTGRPRFPVYVGLAIDKTFP